MCQLLAASSVWKESVRTEIKKLALYFVLKIVINYVL